MLKRKIDRDRWFQPHRIGLILLVLASLGARARDEPITVAGLKNPESVVVGPDGRIYLTLLGDPGRSGDGSIVVVDPKGKITSFTTGFDDPRGLVVVGESMFVADRTRIWRVDARGKAELYVPPTAFPKPPVELNDLAADDLGVLYVSDVGDRRGNRAAIYRINLRREVSIVLDGALTMPRIIAPAALLVDDEDHLFIGDSGAGTLYRYDLALETLQPLSGGFGAIDGMTRDRAGRLFVGDSTTGRLFGFYSELEPPRLIEARFRSVADLAMSGDGRSILVPDRKAGTLTWFPIP